ncbi:MAG: glycosyltransferase family 4 protein [Magnetospirillum sp.]|nr:glycosyltransferase family 4 protein [Magnetospirillum sp.]
MRPDERQLTVVEGWSTLLGEGGRLDADGVAVGLVPCRPLIECLRDPDLPRVRRLVAVWLLPTETEVALAQSVGLRAHRFPADPVPEGDRTPPTWVPPPAPTRPRGLAARLGLRRRPTVGLFYKFVPPPWGGGNQFMMALRAALKRMGFPVIENRISKRVDGYLINAYNFDLAAAAGLNCERERVAVVHRLNGPIRRYRPTGADLDDVCLDVNRRLATASVMQSVYTWQGYHDIGFQFADPVVIPNACDPQTFFSDPARRPFEGGRKLRLICTSWSANPLKGGPTYQWMDRNLDWERYSFTFVGRVEQTFANIRVVPPLPPAALADLLRQHDVFVTASRFDPCSNALIEAQTCGLPALYLDSGGHPELVGAGGLSFAVDEDIPDRLAAVAADWPRLAAQVAPPNLQQVVERYLALLFPGGWQ